MNTLVWIIGTLVFGLAAGLIGGAVLARWWLRRYADHEDAAQEVVTLRRHLVRAQRMEALGILSGSIMHNLNNLLSVVLGQARLARENLPRESPAWQNVSQVIQAAEAAADLSREVDAYHREDDQDRRPIRLQPVVSSTVKLVRDILPDTVSIESRIDADCGPVLASRTQLQQMLMSLCSNAYHAMFRRRGRITISLQAVVIEERRAAVPDALEPGHYVVLSVEDNGRGMDDATLGRIFEPYFSARAPRRGAGLGLTMVTRLLAANNAATEVSSIPGRGTRFALYFPTIVRSVRERDRHALRLVDSRDQAPALAPAAESGSPLRPVHVLLVEDDTQVSATIRAVLEQAGLTVTSFEDGAVAVAAFSRDPAPYHLLLTDRFLPGLDGPEVIQEVHRLRPRLPAVLMSGHPGEVESRGPGAPAISATLAKPFPPRRLLEVVRSALAADPRAFEGRA